MNDREVHIGQAAALYGLAPSTVRWWESRGVLAPVARDGGKRVYRDADLRRIGVAYLCCVVGKMPLDQAALVASGQATHDAWQRAVDAQIAAMGQRIAELEAARDYLRHLLHCDDDDMAQCHYLARELFAHTPRGRVADADLVAAALAAPAVRDENDLDGDEKPGTCAVCAAPITRADRGRRRKYCSRACRQHAYRTRRK